MLSVRDLVVDFNGVRALDRVTVSFTKRGIIGVIGPNGAGKTTLLDVLSGFLRPSSGHCFYDNLDLAKASPEAIAERGIGRTFQTLRLVMQVSVMENVLLAFPNQRGESLPRALLAPLLYRRDETERLAKAREILKSFDLVDATGQLAGTLSFGQQKLLTLACAFARQSRVLLLDEPVSGIHPELKHLILRRLEQLAEVCAVVIVEHDLDAIRAAAARVVVLDDGRVVAEGGADEVLQMPEVLDAYVG